MNTNIKPTTTSLLQFTVNKKQVDKQKTLKTSVLYNKIEDSVNSSLILYRDDNFPNFKSLDFDMVQNAYLNDKLTIKNKIKKLSNNELVLGITVLKKERDKQDIICKATFGYVLQKAS